MSDYCYRSTIMVVFPEQGRGYSDGRLASSFTSAGGHCLQYAFPAPESSQNPPRQLSIVLL